MRRFKSVSTHEVVDESKTNGALTDLPLNNYTGTNFPTDATASNFLLINDVAIVKRDEFLTYSVVSNSNSGLVTATESARVADGRGGSWEGVPDVAVRGPRVGVLGVADAKVGGGAVAPPESADR